MPIFRRDEPTQPAARPLPAARVATSASGERPAKTTYIAPGSKIVGIITGQAETLVEGELEGEMKLDSRVVIGPNGKVRGNITARSVSISGQLIGNVHGLDRVELTASASLEGNLAAPQVVIAEGAFFKGQVEMAGKDGRSAEKRPEIPARPSQSVLPADRRPPHEGRNPQGG